MLWGAFICCLETINALNEFKLIIMELYLQILGCIFLTILSIGISILLISKIVDVLKYGW